MRFFGGPGCGRLLVGMRLPDGPWLSLDACRCRRRGRGISKTFLVAFLLMTAAAALLILWAVRRLTRPVATLAAAAERARARRECAAAAGERSDRGRDGGGGLQHDGRRASAASCRTAPSC